MEADPKPITGKKQWLSAGSSSMRNPSLKSLQETPWPRSITRLLAKECARGGVVIVGMGHPLRSDDYVGSLIAKDLARKVGNQEKVRIIDAENSPENILHVIWKNEPSLLVLIDSVDAGLPPGSITLVDLNETTYPFFTTHNIPLKLIFQAGPEVPRAVILGVQPGTLEVGDLLSEEVQEARAIIVQELGRIFREWRSERDAG